MIFIRSYSLFLVLVSLFVFGVLSHPGKAQQMHDSCEQAEHTADIITCLNRRHDAVGDRLNETFLKILKQYQDTGQDVSVLWDIQKGWLAYRDQECERQVDDVETESLKRVQELDCLTSLTEQRIGILELSFEKDEPPEEQTALPLWMNVVGKDKPRVYWNYSERIKGDLNCDGVQDDIMAGMGGTDEDQLDGVIAIAQTPETGRPQVDFFESTDFLALGDGTLEAKECVGHFDIKVVDYPYDRLGAYTIPVESLKPTKKPDISEVEDTDKHENEDVCAHALRIEHKTCGVHLLYWGGEDYKLFFNLDEK